MSANSVHRILYKLSGEFLSSDGKAVCERQAESVAQEIQEVQRSGVSVAVICGAGNIMRGRSTKHAQRHSSDAAGMMATYVNALMIQGFMTPLQACLFGPYATPYVRVYNFQDCFQALNQGMIVFIVGGLGAPYFSTDTLAAVRARELGCKTVFKGTSVDGVYTDDPKKNQSAQHMSTLTYTQAIEKRLGFMDTAALDILRESTTETCVFNRHKYTLAQALHNPDMPCSFVKENSDG